MPPATTTPKSASAAVPPLNPSGMEWRIDTGVGLLLPTTTSSSSGSSSMRGSLTKCVQRWGDVKRNSDNNNMNALLITELQLFRLDMLKQCLHNQQLRQELANISHHKEDLQEQYSQDQQDLKQAQMAAQQVGQSVARWQQYEALAKVAVQATNGMSHAKVQGGIQALEQEKQELQEQHDFVDNVMRKRQSQLQAWLTLLMDMKQTIEEEQAIDDRPSKRHKAEGKEDEGGEPMSVEDALYGDL